MQSQAATGRRKFLASAITATGSVIAAGLSPSGSQAEEGIEHSGATTPTLSLDSLYDSSTLNTSLTGEAADRLAIRRLVDAWAHYADRRLAEQQSNLFVLDGTVLNYEGDPATHEPTSSLRGRAEILKALAVLNTFLATTHFNGQSDVIIHKDHAVGETYCLAHELSTEGGQRKVQVLSIRYHDKFVRQEHRWYFAERKLIIDWVDTRSSTP